MQETGRAYPVYTPSNPAMADQRVMSSFTYGQLVEIANLFYYANKVLAGKMIGGIKLDEAKRSMHKAIHDSAVNCAISMEEKFKLQEGPNAAA